MRIAASVTLAVLAGTALWTTALLGRERPGQDDQAAAGITISTGSPGCSVVLDAAVVGKTDARGRLVLTGVDTGDHYLHVRCPTEPQETAYFVSPHAGQKIDIRHGAAASSAQAAAPNPDAALGAAEAKIKLRQLVQDAVQLRAKGQLDEAVQELHEAAKLDPENSDLHRELGITFLLDKDWKRARVEMLEAIRHDPTDADAHNGLGYALEKLGEVEPASQEYHRATQLEPDDPSYRQHYLEALTRLAALKADKHK
ncbi:MAG TPA: tetratricopeptide repeat protein [Terriglobia bacterium]|nr:tetratricopeptide repeat protein [Terriglobia bacterium]